LGVFAQRSDRVKFRIRPRLREAFRENRRIVMTRKNVIFKSKERTSRERVAAFLRELADKISENAVVLRRDGEAINLDFPDEIQLDVEYQEKPKRRGTKRSLEIELDWGEGGRQGGRVSLG
jgi:amphi-Trp domain-containing protein